MSHRRSTVRRIVALWILALAACAEPPPSRELPLEPLGDQASVYGKLRLTPSPRGHTGFTVSIVGLDPGATYVLCLNAQDAGSPSSEALGNLGIPGWPLGAFYPSPRGGAEGFWDFEKVQADGQGRYLQHFELPLPPLEYRVKFLVKSNYDTGARPLLTSQPVLLDVRVPLGIDDVLKGIAALAVIPVAFIVRGRGRRRAPSGSEEELAAEASFEPEPMPAPLEAVPVEASSALSEVAPPQPSGCARTLVERARADGVLLHHKNYAWIEIHGKRKSFRPRQALVFRILCEHDPNCDGLPQDEIIKAWEEVFRAKRANPVRVRDIFRSCEHEPGDFIVRVAGPASVYRLRLEPTPPPMSAQLEGESNGFDSLHDEG